MRMPFALWDALAGATSRSTLWAERYGMRLLVELAEGNRGPISGALPNRPQLGS
jgi:hypothetical protein